MAKPDPHGGLVFRYDYLWASDGAEGREEGAKARPCAVAVVMLPTRSGATRVVACAITHTEPEPPTQGIPIPADVKKHLGLDDARSWVIVSEVNLVDWTDPGIEPVAPGHWFYGTLPPAFAEAIRDRIVALHEQRRLPLVNRPQIEARRVAREE